MICASPQAESDLILCEVILEKAQKSFESACRKRQLAEDQTQSVQNVNQYIGILQFTLCSYYVQLNYICSRFSFWLRAHYSPLCFLFSGCLFFWMCCWLPSSPLALWWNLFLTLNTVEVVGKWEVVCYIVKCCGSPFRISLQRSNSHDWFWFYPELLHVALLG